MKHTESSAILDSLYLDLESLEKKNVELFLENHELKKKIATLFDKIKHGSEDHQAWLQKELKMHFR